MYMYISKRHLGGKIGHIKTEEDFNNFVEYLESLELDDDTDYEYYNKAFEKFYGHPAFDENGNTIE